MSNKERLIEYLLSEFALNMVTCETRANVCGRYKSMGELTASVHQTPHVMSLLKPSNVIHWKKKTRRRRRWIYRVGVMKMVLTMGGKGSSPFHAAVSSEDILSILRQ
jgi:hypothetical protein